MLQDSPKQNKLEKLVSILKKHAFLYLKFCQQYSFFEDQFKIAQNEFSIFKVQSEKKLSLKPCVRFGKKVFRF